MVIHFPGCGARACRCRKTGYWIALSLAMVLFVFEAWGGVYSWSFALLADSWHVLTHLPFYGLAIYAYAFARQDKKQFEIWMAYLLFAVSLVGVVASPFRILLPEVHPEEVLWISAVGLVVNGIMFILAHFSGKEEHHEEHYHEYDGVHEGVWLHIMGDMLMSVVTVAAALLMLTEIPTIWEISPERIDAGGAFIINAYIAFQAYDMWERAKCGGNVL